MGSFQYHSASKEKENEILQVTSVVSVNSDAVKFPNVWAVCRLGLWKQEKPRMYKVVMYSSTLSAKKDELRSLAKAWVDESREMSCDL